MKLKVNAAPFHSNSNNSSFSSEVVGTSPVTPKLKKSNPKINSSSSKALIPYGAKSSNLYIPPAKREGALIVPPTDPERQRALLAKKNNLNLGTKKNNFGPNNLRGNLNPKIVKFDPIEGKGFSEKITQVIPPTLKPSLSKDVKEFQLVLGQKESRTALAPYKKDWYVPGTTYRDRPDSYPIENRKYSFEERGLSFESQLAQVHSWLSTESSISINMYPDLKSERGTTLQCSIQIAQKASDIGDTFFSLRDFLRKIGRVVYDKKGIVTYIIGNTKDLIDIILPLVRIEEFRLTNIEKDQQMILFKRALEIIQSGDINTLEGFIEMVHISYRLGTHEESKTYSKIDLETLVKESFKLKNLKLEKAPPEVIQAQVKQREKAYQIAISNQKERKFNMRIGNAEKTIFDANTRKNNAQFEKNSKNQNNPSEL
jgi:hypothetical protein